MLTRAKRRVERLVVFGGTMADISKCDGVYHKNKSQPSIDGTAICPFREGCWRHTAIADPLYQSWVEAKYNHDTDKCEMFYGRK